MQFRLLHHVDAAPRNKQPLDNHRQNLRNTVANIRNILGGSLAATTNGQLIEINTTSDVLDTDIVGELEVFQPAAHRMLERSSVGFEEFFRDEEVCRIGATDSCLCSGESRK